MTDPHTVETWQEMWPALADYEYVRPEHYAGECYGGTIDVYSMHRNSDALARSNFERMCRDFDDLPGFFVTRASYWAGGWIETLRCDPREASPSSLSDLSDALTELADDVLADIQRELAIATSCVEEETALWDDSSIADRVAWIRSYNNRAAYQRTPIFAARHPYWDLGKAYPDVQQWFRDCVYAGG